MRCWADYHTHNLPVVVYHADYATNYSTDNDTIRDPVSNSTNNFINDTVHSHHAIRAQSHHILVLPEWHSTHNHHLNHDDNDAVHYYFLSANSHTMSVRPCHHRGPHHDHDCLPRLDSSESCN
jgi:hypothetical protein